MADSLSVEEWRKFLNARIVQEQGNDAKALEVFDSLLEAHPRNAHLLASRTFALQRLESTSDALASSVASKYAALGSTLVGDRDDPEKWATELSKLIDELDTAEPSAMVEGALVAW
jgi:hypothetical protein